MKHKRLIYIQISADVEVYLDMVRVLSGDQKMDVLDVLKVSLWQYYSRIVQAHSLYTWPINIYI